MIRPSSKGASAKMVSQMTLSLWRAWSRRTTSPCLCWRHAVAYPPATPASRTSLPSKSLLSNRRTQRRALPLNMQPTPKKSRVNNHSRISQSRKILPPSSRPRKSRRRSRRTRLKSNVHFAPQCTQLVNLSIELSYHSWSTTGSLTT